ncbi:hypothetical protein, partial [Brevundimonas sp.]|uniref:hypothetical protein n=1 Tax=Brevundimonas sp. TaxID=1871086 RepID=UPI0028AF76BE
MTTRLLVNAASAALLLLAGAAIAETPPSSTPDAAAVHRRALVLDGHADILLPSTPARYWLPGGGSRVDLDHLTRG